MFLFKSEKLKYYESLLSLSYNQLIFKLIEKYGPVKDDYFREKSYARYLNGEIKTPGRGKYSRASDGLYCHHIEEDKYENISNFSYIKHYNYPYAIQKKDKLVYCDMFEHLILHALIIKRTDGEFGANGYYIFLKPIIEDWMIGGMNPKPTWMKAAKKRAYLTKRETKKILKEITRFLK
ncbi:hypothetical protein [Pediococcus pentosaceus]|uniref:hypothetical protein n=1 Tax=Pediococcus pentosaceus TaxID=1255 RepID=UPI000A8E9E43|nr:hypothetical protein [Pediococcus pentosaceus]MCM6821197.1 hypothetical protein [Pediococcus pentosaceus]